MKQKWKEHVEEHVKPMKLVKKKLMSKAKEVQKMLQWKRMNPEEYQWAKRAGLGGLFNIKWFTL
jgi:hypothetical protein